ncbi:MAG TPA: arginine--tRNA ligase, partial [Candidatus Aenigmarchaeota archaeon]|nr:arginine--tRNA ligase [Candidatus Aenigmarchaeota archaeon]
REFMKIYRILGVSFDYFLGESEYLRESKDIVSRALQSGVAKKSEGAVIIEFDDMPPLVIQKSDEATLYQTRDIAALEFRMKKFRPEKILYVVGSEQSLYFKQVFAAAEKLGIKHTGVHVPFGLVSLPEGKMSTRKGRVVFLEELIEKAIQLAERIIEEKNPCLKRKKETARMVGIGAIKYNDLSRDRIKDIRFDWNTMLSFDGNTGPYLQYTHARASSILRKSGVRSFAKFDASLLREEEEKLLLRKILLFGEVIKSSARDYKPHYIAVYAYELATLFNDFYESIPVLRSEEKTRITRLALVESVRIVLRNALWLLGIDAPERM